MRKSIISYASVFLVNMAHKCIGLYLKGIPHFKITRAFGHRLFKWWVRLQSGSDIREDIVGSYIFEAFDSHKIGGYKKLLEKARLYVRFNLIGKTVGDMSDQDVRAMLDYNPNNEVHQAMLRALNTIIVEVCKVDKNVFCSVPCGWYVL